MYQFSRSLYRELAPLVMDDRWGAAVHRHLDGPEADLTEGSMPGWFGARRDRDMDEELHFH